jgi:ribosomal protein S27E
MTYAYVDCPHCGREAKIEDSLVGQNVNCPRCDELFLAETGGSYDLEGSTPQADPESQRRPVADGPRDPEPDQASEEKQPRKGWLEEWPQD